MGQQTRNHSVAGVALLVGAAAIAFAATQPWITGAGALWGRLAGITVNGSLGFDLLVAPGGEHGDVKPVLFGCAAALAVLALLLFVTRVPGLGVLWRFLALATLVLVGFTAWAAWSVVGSPASVVADPDSLPGQGLDIAVDIAETIGVATIRPGLGLWVLTIGFGVTGIGALIPASRGTGSVTDRRIPIEPQSLGAAMPPGWYPDQFDARFVRFFDGNRWTGATQPRG
jgi:hypothetical protein